MSIEWRKINEDLKKKLANNLDRLCDSKFGGFVKENLKLILMA